MAFIVAPIAGLWYLTMTGDGAKISLGGKRKPEGRKKKGSYESQLRDGLCGVGAHLVHHLPSQIVRQNDSRFAGRG